MMKISILFLVILFSPSLWAEETTNSTLKRDELSATEMLMLNQIAYPSLGLSVVNMNDDGLVLRSKNQRYFVKGVVSDLWDGISESLEPLPDVPQIPELLKPNDYSMVYGEGDEYIRVFLTPSCDGCMVTLDTLSYYFDPFKHRIELVWLFNNAEDKKTVQHLLCRSPAWKDIGQVIAESIEAQDVPCYDPRLVIGYTLALQQKVYALPYYTTEQGHTVSRITDNPFK